MSHEKKYQIFVSSTYSDLKQERAMVQKQILQSLHFPIGMEMFSAGDEEQWKKIAETIDSSDIFVLILGNRYGSRDPKTKLSYTEKEYNYAIEKKIPTLVFFSDPETDRDFDLQIKNVKKSVSDGEKASENHRDFLKYIYQEHYDQKQTLNIAFRLKVLSRRVFAQSFSRTYYIDPDKQLLTKHIEIEVVNPIMDTIRNLPLGGWVRQLEYNPRLSTKVQLMEENPRLFHMAATENLEFARVLPTGQSLESETSFQQIINEAESGFWANTTSFKLFYTNQLLFENAVKRGVDIRLLLVDPETETENGLNNHLFYNTNKAQETNDKNKALFDMKSVVDRALYLKKDISKKGYKGDINIKFSRKPNYALMWIRDANTPNGIAHINTVNFLTGFKPHFRFSPQTSERLFSLLTSEFLTYWNDEENLSLEDYLRREGVS